MGKNIFSKTITVLMFMSTFIAQHTLGQITDNFSDGNFSANPGWSGTTGNYIVNALGRLQLNAAVAGSSYLQTPLSIPANHNAQWEFLINQNLSGSATNFTRVYLMSDSPDPMSALNGYYLQFGETGSNDAIELFRQSGTSHTSVLRGSTAFVFAPFTLRVRITRSSTGMWEMFADGAAGTNFTSQGSATDNTFQSTSYFIIRSTYTLTNITNFSYDDFLISTTQAPDTSAPTLSSVTCANANQIDLNFSEPLDVTAPLVPTDFILNNLTTASSATFQNSNSTIRLAFDQSMVNGVNQNIHHPAVADLSGNILSSGNQNFLFFQPALAEADDIIINEVYADPSPSIGLPEYEFIEIYNRSIHPFQLAGWQLTDGTTTATMTSRILLPGEYLVLTSNAATSQFNNFGLVMGVSTFPSLNNSGDNIQLKSPESNLIDAFSYSLASYADEDKDAGGFSLERIDPTDFCKGAANWKASDSNIGGTPGQQNSVYAVTPDLIGPRILSVEPKTSNTITMLFDEKLSAILPPLSNIDVSPAVGVTAVSFRDETLMAVDVTFAIDLDSALAYTVVASEIFDCPGNEILNEFSSKTFKMDQIKPIVESVAAISSTELRVHFSERILSTTLPVDALVFTPEIGDFSVTVVGEEVVIALATPLVNGLDYEVSFEGIEDRFGNEIDPEVLAFRYFVEQPSHRNDIVITEFLADPTPTAGLPEAEFIEIFNRSAKPFDLAGWTLTDGTSVATFPSKIILPQQYLIICQSANLNAFSTFGRTIALSNVPSLNNTSDQIKIANEDGVTIDSIYYQSTWYQDGDKNDGGWSIEKIDPSDYCREEENWRVSNAAAGGTPGHQNSVYEIRTDQIRPHLLSISVIQADSVVIQFSERLMAGVDRQTNFQFENLTLTETSFIDRMRKSVGVKFSNVMDSVSTYQINLVEVADCSGNLASADSTIYFKLDSTPPSVKKVVAEGLTAIHLVYSEKISLAQKGIYVLDGLVVENVSQINATTVSLQPKVSLINGRKYQLTLFGTEDLAGNKMDTTDISVRYFEPFPIDYKDIVITEILADPSPVVALPEVEFVEIYNRSAHAIQLDGWVFADGSHLAVVPEYILLPKEFLVLTLAGKVASFSTLVPTLGLTAFPSLTNSGESLSLRDSSGNIIDSLFYSDDWYRDSEKLDGGYSLEIIDPDNVCSEGENWTSSIDPSGGTPGKTNSVNANKPDHTPPELLSVIPLSADTLEITFNEKLNEVLPIVTSFVINPIVRVENVLFRDQSKRSLLAVLGEPLQKQVEYAMTVEDVYDCAGNVSGVATYIFGVPEKALPGDVVINEILFNPRPTGVDFVEVINRSTKYINLEGWKMANVVSDTVRNRKEIFTKASILRPNQILAFTSDPNTLKGEYLQGDETAMVRATLPPLSDDEGSIALLDENDTIMDTLLYSADLHSPLIKNSEGVSLERIDIASPSSNKSNWHSASGSAGYATPGLRNSAAYGDIFDEAVSVNPEIFVPQNGQPDFAMISYHLPHAGYVANIRIVNAQGALVKTLTSNEILGLEGFFTWSGDTDNLRKATIGPYMVWFEVFDLEGHVTTFKKRVVIADKF